MEKVRFCPYSAYHILFKKQEPGAGKRRGKMRMRELDIAQRKEKNQIKREKK